MTCEFCSIVTGVASATGIREWPDALAIRPRSGGVNPGHVLVLPRVHVDDVSTDPVVTAAVMQRAAELAASHPHVNVIASRGSAATQTFPRGQEPVVHCRNRRPDVPVPDTSRQGVPHAVAASAHCGREARR